MKKWLLLLLLAVLGVFLWFFLVTKRKPKDEVPKDQPVAMSRHSQAFNQSLNAFLTAYDSLTESFVNWDSVAVTANAVTLRNDLGAVKWTELQKDTVIYQTAAGYSDIFKSDLEELSGAGNLAAKRHAFHSFSQNLYDLLRTVKYDGAKVYLQQCPMAFGENTEGIWLSKAKKIRNPYLGLHDPEYRGTMISCGETKDTLNFQAAP